MIDPNIEDSTGETEPKPPKFPFGQVVTTPGALANITRDEMFAAIQRHQSGDWGDLVLEDQLANELGLIQGLRLFSAYQTEQGIKFWIITEHDHSVTTVLLPDEY